MISSSRNGFKADLSSILRIDREFREAFTDLLLEYDDNDITKLTELLIDRLEGRSGMGIQRGLIDLLGDRKMIIFIRVMKMTKTSIPWSRRLRNFAFTDDTGIDLSRLSKGTVRIRQFKVFDNLDNQERSILEQLSTAEIDLVSDLTSLGFNLFLKISRLSKTEISFLLSLKTEQLESLIKLGFENMAALESKTDESISKLNRRERTSLRHLLDEHGGLMKNFSIKENVDEMLRLIVESREEDLIAVRLGRLRSFDETETNIIERIPRHVFKLASTLTRTELDEILLLPEGMFETMSREELRKLAQDFPGGYHPTPTIRDTVLGLLVHDQTTVLNRIHKLPPPAVAMLFNLDLGRIKEIMTSGVGSNRREEYLIRTLKNLSPRNRHDIAYMTDEEWTSFHGTALIDPNGPEIEVLRAMNLLNVKQLDFVKQMSRTGLGILATNSRLGPKTINSIMQLGNEEEQEFLLNLDLRTRFLIGNGTRNHNLTSVGEELLEEMSKLNEKEKWWSGQTKFTELLGYLNRHRVKVFGDLFEKIESDKHPVFDVWNGKEPSEFDTKLLANVIIAQRPKTIEFLPVLDFLDSIFFMELLQLSVEDSYDEPLRFNIIQEIRRRDFKVRDLVNVYDYSKRQHVQSLRWILMNSLKPENEILFHFARVTLFDYLQGRNNLTFEQIFHPTSEEVVPALHKQFVIKEYHLAKAFFPVPTHSKRLFEILDPVDCSIFLESVVTKATVEIPSDLVPLLKKLPKEKVVGFFDSPWGREFLHHTLTNGEINPLRHLRHRLTDGEMKYIIRKNNYSLVKELSWYPRTGEAAQHSATILQMLREIDPDIPIDYFIQQATELISAVQWIAPPNQTVSVVRSLMIDPIELPNLDPRVRTILLNEVTNGCKNSLIPCIDSRDIRELPSGARKPLISIKTCPILTLLSGQHDEIAAREPSDLNIISEIADRITSVPRGSIVKFLALVGPVSINIATDHPVQTMLLDHSRERMLWEDHSIYWSMFLTNETSQTGEIHLEADGEILQRFVSRVIDRFEASYDWIGLSLPRWIVRKSDYYVRSLPLNLAGASGTSSLMDIVPCVFKTDMLPSKLVFDRRAVVRNPYERNETQLDSSLLPKQYKDYHSVCGPSASALEVETIFQYASTHFDEFCNAFPSDFQWFVSTERYRLPGTVSDLCQNFALYETNDSTRSNSMLYIAQDYFEWESTQSRFIDLIFLGNEINFIDLGSEMTTNHFMLKGDLSTCKIHKKGLNFFYTDKNELLCDLDITQDNVAVIHGNFGDSEFISSVIGSGIRNKITISHASFVDGCGGNDEIIALHPTIVAGHFGDLIIGTATVVLPGRIDQIRSVTIEPETYILWYGNLGRIEVDRNCKLMLANGYHVEPIESYPIRRIVLRKTLQVHAEYHERLTELRNTRNENFQLLKYSSTANHDIMTTDWDHSVFIMKLNDHRYYWEAAPNTTNLYIFTQLNSTATISRANGILDLASYNMNIEDIALRRNEVDLTISYQSLKVILLANYNEVKLTFDGRKYYRLCSDDLERDYCSHPMKMTGTMSIDYLEFIYHFNCLDVKSDKLHLVRSNENLILVWNSGTLYLKNYHMFVHNEWDLSVRLNSYIMEPAEFRQRASNPSSIKYYEIDKRGLEIYHNQPDNKYDIGLINLGDWSLKKCDMMISDDDLSIALGVNSSVRVKNWLTHPSSRELVFYFGDEIILNSACLVSKCSPHDVLHEFGNMKSQGSRSKRETNNFGFFFLVFQNWLDRKYPLPVQHCKPPEEIFADAYTLTETFKDALDKTAEEFDIPLDGFDFFNVYKNISRLMRAEKHSLILDDFHKIAETVGFDGDIILDRFFENIKEIC